MFPITDEDALHDQTLAKRVWDAVGNQHGAVICTSLFNMRKNLKKDDVMVVILADSDEII